MLGAFEAIFDPNARRATVSGQYWGVERAYATAGLGWKMWMGGDTCDEPGDAREMPRSLCSLSTP